VFGIEGKKLLKPEDDYEALRDFTHAFEGTTTMAEGLHLEYQRLMQENPALAATLDRLPRKIFSGKRHPSPDAQAVFFCYTLPAPRADLDGGERRAEAAAWSEEAGRTAWYLYDLKTEKIEADVFDNGGFDVVLANPPYGATVADNVRDLYFDRRTEGAQSKETYGLFIARGVQLLRDGGQLCYIVSDTWRTIKTHKPLRRRLVEKTTVWHVLDLPSWIFNATVNTGILTLTKRAATDEHQLRAAPRRRCLPHRR